jgi:hypothetical protein
MSRDERRNGSCEIGGASTESTSINTTILVAVSIHCTISQSNKHLGNLSSRTSGSIKVGLGTGNIEGSRSIQRTGGRTIVTLNRGGSSGSRSLAREWQRRGRSRTVGPPGSHTGIDVVDVSSDVKLNSGCVMKPGHSYIDSTRGNSEGVQKSLNEVFERNHL